jgi:hypothetical protein
MLKKVLIMLIFVVLSLTVVGVENQASMSIDPMMIIGVQSRNNIPDVKSITLIKRRVSEPDHLCRQVPVVPPPGENPMSLLYIYDSAGEILFKTAFNYPIAKTVPLLAPSTAAAPETNDSTPGLIFIKEPEVYLLVPYFKEADFIEIYNPGESFPITIKEFDKINIEIFDERKKNRGTVPAWTLSNGEGKFQVLIIASGYGTADMNTFTRLAEELKGYLLSNEPFHTYAADIEVNIYENTEDLECKNGCNGIDRLMCCHSGKVISAAAASGYSFDEIIVLHNTSVYSGGGHREFQDAYKTNSYSSYAMSYSGSHFKKVVLHEMGHSFGNLCDEYTYDSEGYSYVSCVNCRDNCAIWSYLTPICQESCGAKRDYFRPGDSIMLTLDIEHFNPVSLYALYLPHGLVKRLRYFIYGTTPLNIILQANRKEENAWLIKRHYGEIDIIVDNPDDDSVSKLIVFRRNIGASDQLIKEIPFSDFQNNSYSFIDKFLDTDMTYTYRVEALDSTGKVIGVSNEENI